MIRARLTCKISWALCRFRETVKAEPGVQWICKPTGLNQGHGIYVVPDGPKFVETLDAEAAERARSPMRRQPPARIIQRYIHNPLLLHGRKFDIRCYMLVATSKPVTAFYGGEGYCRLSIEEYAGASAENVSAHLTNQAVQKKHPRYKELVDDTTWSMAQLAEYMNEQLVPASDGQVPENWAHEVLPGRIKEIMSQVCYCDPFRWQGQGEGKAPLLSIRSRTTNAAVLLGKRVDIYGPVFGLQVAGSIQNKLDPRVGMFDLLGLDFLIDDQLGVWLLECNVNPALHTNGATLKQVRIAVIRGLELPDSKKRR